MFMQLPHQVKFHSFMTEHIAAIIEGIALNVSLSNSDFAMFITKGLCISKNVDNVGSHDSNKSKNLKEEVIFFSQFPQTRCR